MIMIFKYSKTYSDVWSQRILPKIINSNLNLDEYNFFHTDYKTTDIFCYYFDWFPHVRFLKLNKDDSYSYIKEILNILSSDQEYLIERKWIFFNNNDFKKTTIENVFKNSFIYFIMHRNFNYDNENYFNVKNLNLEFKY